MDELKKKLLDYGQYLDDIRRRILKLVIVFIIFFISGFLLTGKILGSVINLLKIKNVTIVTNSPFQFIDLAMNTGILIAIIFCLPIAIYLIYGFLKDGLQPKEKKFFFILLPIGFLLFFIGFIYGFAILYYALGLIANINIKLGVINLWDIDKFLSQIIMTAALLGLIFEFPLVLTFLIRTKIIDQDFLKKKRRLAYALMFVVVSLLPPTDGLSLIIMVLPLIIIYELTILLNRFHNKNIKY